MSERSPSACGAPQRCADAALGDAEQRLNDERCAKERDPDRLSRRVLTREECARRADEQVDREGEECGADRALGTALYLRRAEWVARLGAEAPNEYRRCCGVDERRGAETEKGERTARERGDYCCCSNDAAPGDARDGEGQRETNLCAPRRHRISVLACSVRARRERPPQCQCRRADTPTADSPRRARHQ